MIEYSITFLMEHPWLAILIGGGFLCLLLLPEQWATTYEENAVRTVYDSPLLYFERRCDGWTIRMPIITRVQRAITDFVGQLWRRVRNVFVAAITAALEQAVKGE